MSDLFGKLGKGLVDLGKDAGKLVDNIAKEGGKRVGDLTQEGSKFVDNLSQEGGKVAGDLGKVAGDLGKNVQKLTDKASAITESGMLSTLDWAYQQTLSGLPGQKDIYEFVYDYTSKYDRDTAIEKMIQAQTTKAGTSGFVTGFGGIVTMPITIPANVTSVILFQMRMIMAVAIIRGYDPKDDEVQTFVYAVLAGTSVSEIVKKAGITIGNKLAMSAVKKIPGKVLTKINQAVGFRLATKFGSTGVINIGKMVPVVGAVVGGVFDTATTLAIGNIAKNTFTECGIDLEDGTILETHRVSEEDIPTSYEEAEILEEDSVEEVKAILEETTESI